MERESLQYYMMKLGIVPIFKKFLNILFLLFLFSLLRFIYFFGNIKFDIVTKIYVAMISSS